uniref:Major facilitator superfamily (MFS) profile domain-containing protein n=1 Tax=Panagrolaimus davidi TaxID=227884 RepID=A0A914PV56_9BILA
MDNNKKLLFGNNFRYLIIILSLIGLTFVFGNPLILNFTIICMNKHSINNETTTVPLYTSFEQSWLFSVVAIGNLCGTFVVTQLTRLLGGRYTFTIYGIISGIATILMPFAVSLGFWPLVFIRMFQGAGAAITFAAMSVIVDAWAPLKTTGFIISVVSSYVQLGPMYTMPVASAFCQSSLGWQGTFYLQGSLTVLSFLTFFFIYRDSPRLHTFVSEKECSIIEKDKDHTSSKHSSFVPYRKIFSDCTVYGLFFTAFSNLLGQQIFLIYGAVYLNQILKLSVEATGFAGLIANFSCLILKLIISPISDYATCVNQKHRAIIITGIAHFIFASAFFVLALIDERNQILGEIMYILTILVSSLQSLGFIKTAQLSCRQYAYVVMSVVACINCLIVLFLPAFVTIIAPKNTSSQWHWVFWVIGALIISSIFVYAFTARTEPRSWALQKQNQPVTFASKISTNNITVNRNGIVNESIDNEDDYINIQRLKS